MTLESLESLGYINLVIYLIGKVVDSDSGCNFGNSVVDMFSWGEDQMGHYFWCEVYLGRNLKHNDELIKNVIG